VPEDQEPAAHRGITEGTMELIKEKAQLRKQIVLGRGGEVSRADHERLRELRKAANKAL
jgi:hypothetical protein